MPITAWSKMAGSPYQKTRAGFDVINMFVYAKYTSHGRHCGVIRLMAAFSCLE